MGAGALSTCMQPRACILAEGGVRVRGRPSRGSIRGWGGHPLAAAQHAAFPFSDAGSDSAGDLGSGRVDGWPWCGAEAHMDGVSVLCRCLRWRPVRWPSTQGSWSCRTALLISSPCFSRRWKTWCCRRRWTCWCLSGWAPACW